MNEYLAINSGGYVYEQPSRINCGMAGCFTETFRWYLIEQVYQGVKCIYSTFSSPEDWILCYRRNYICFLLLHLEAAILVSELRL